MIGLAEAGRIGKDAEERSRAAVEQKGMERDQFLSTAEHLQGLWVALGLGDPSEPEVQGAESLSIGRRLRAIARHLRGTH